MRKIKYNLGFTLIELLVAVGITITLATMVVGIIVASFRTSNASSTQERLRLAGTNALTQVTGMLRYSEFDSETTSGVRSETCQRLDSDNSASVDSITFKYHDQTRIIACNDTSELTLDGNPLIDSNNVDVWSCDISCTQNSAADPPVVNITLDLHTAGSDSLPESTGVIYSLSQSARIANLAP